MGEKVYKPIVKDGDHLIRSKDNPDRVRGLTRDENNQNPDIIEWEEYDVDDLQSDDYAPYPYEEQRVQSINTGAGRICTANRRSLGCGYCSRRNFAVPRGYISLVEKYSMAFGQGKGT